MSTRSALETARKALAEMEQARVSLGRQRHALLLALRRQTKLIAALEESLEEQKTQPMLVTLDEKEIPLTRDEMINEIVSGVPEADPDDE